jgi:ribonucleotide reductase alpha subunit
MTQWKWKQRISSEIFDMKYKFHRESVEQVFDDVATVVASAETEEKRQEMKEQFYQMMIEEKFIPAGRILANAWPNSPIQNYMNCYTIGVDDSMEDIYNSLKEDAMISKVGGGVGFDVSNLRPKNSDLSVGGVASGPISFLKVFDASAKVIMTGGARRAAHIALMDVAHPDIEEFITVKQGDKNKALTQFNISVKVTDKFIEAVKNDDDWNLEFEGKVYKTVKAKYLYDLMSKNAFINNEPGIFNVDTINRYNNGFWAFDINEVNPCFTGDTLVAVADGRNAVRFDELAKEGRDVPVYAKDDNGKTVIKMMRNISLTRKDAQLVEITLDDDSKIKCTPDHRIMLRDGSYKEAKDLVANESLKPFNSYISNKNYRQIQSGTKRDRRQYRMIAEYNNLIVDPKTTAIHHNDYDSFNDSINNLVIMSHEEHRKLHAERMMGKNNPYHKKSKEWQSKMASHPGEKNGRYSGYTDEQLISLMIEWIKERNYPMSGDDWRRLAKENGYPQYFTSFRKSLIEMLEKANASCGFNFSKDKYKQREYRKKMMATAMINHKVKSVKYIHSEDVYDGTVDDVHNFAVITSNKDDKFIESSGVFVHNCGEIVMPRYSICCLSSTNLASFVKNKFEDNAYFDFDEFGRVVRLGVRFLDNILSVAKYPLKKIEENALGWRRIGLGFTALGNAFQYMKNGVWIARIKRVV